MPNTIPARGQGIVRKAVRPEGYPRELEVARLVVERMAVLTSILRAKWIFRRESDQWEDRLRGTPFQPEGPGRHRYKVLKAITLLLLATLVWNTALANDREPRRRGTVIIIRGAFTVFSLGMNELGEKLSQHGLDVKVVADITARRAASKLKAQFQRNKNVGPIVFIGHSRGAELGPKQARYLQRYGIPVKLVVMVDAVHQTTIPKNVERCVNLYHDGTLGLVHGVPARAESKRTTMLNVDIDRLSSRNRGGSINHFNIDSSPWIHDLVIAQVLKACPKAGSASKSRLAGAPLPATNQNDVQVTIRERSSSGLIYPTRILTGLWAVPGHSPIASSSSRFQSTNATSRPRSRTHPSGGSPAPDKEPARRAPESNEAEGARSPWSLGTAIQIDALSKPRAAKPPETSEIESPENPQGMESTPRQSKKAENDESSSKASNQSRDLDETDASDPKSSRSPNEGSSSKSEPECEKSDTRKKPPPVQVKLSG
ncbi:MAG: hypothetical protein R6U98_18215 [Pirellulaceae bacterium]